MTLFQNSFSRVMLLILSFRLSLHFPLVSPQKVLPLLKETLGSITSLFPRFIFPPLPFISSVVRFSLFYCLFSHWLQFLNSWSWYSLELVIYVLSPFHPNPEDMHSSSLSHTLCVQQGLVRDPTLFALLAAPLASIIPQGFSSHCCSADTEHNFCSETPDTSWTCCVPKSISPSPQSSPVEGSP